MIPLVNDRWCGTFKLIEMGNYYYTVQAWVDRFKSWREDFTKKMAAGQDSLLIGSRARKSSSAQQSAPRAKSEIIESFRGRAPLEERQLAGHGAR